MRQASASGLTRVRCARVEQRVRVGDELQLSVQVRQAGAGKGHEHLTVAPHLHAIHVGGHVERPQSGGDGHLQVWGWEESVGRQQRQGRVAGPTHRVLLPQVAVLQGQACGEETWRRLTFRRPLSHFRQG